MNLIEQIEKLRNSQLLVYYTGDRQGQEIRIAGDIHPFCSRQLEQIGEVERIDLFLYGPGGLTMAGYGLVNLIREFCKEFNVIIPFRALSCATLIALGANEIIMTKNAMLSPVDPSVEHPLGPTVDFGQGPKIVPVNVEDVISFINLAKTEAGLNDSTSLCKIFEKLSQVHPLTLGAVNRSRQEIAFLARSLLKYHMNDNERVERIVNTLTHERFSHDYLISRREAKETLDLNIVDAELNGELNKAILDLHNKYDELLSLSVPYHPEIYLGSQNDAIVTLNRGILETRHLTHVFRSRFHIQRVEVTVPPSPIPTIAYQGRGLGESWTVDSTI
jgi:D-alanyl-D-alanine dipeptidase